MNWDTLHLNVKPNHLCKDTEKEGVKDEQIPHFIFFTSKQNLQLI